MKELIKVQTWRCHWCWHERSYGHGGWDVPHEPRIECDGCGGKTIHHLMRVTEVEKLPLAIPPWMTGLTQEEIRMRFAE